MLSNILDRISFWSLFITIILLPIFFLPFVEIPVETSKGLLLVIGLAVSIIFWSAARFTDGKIVLPKSWLLVSGLTVVLAVFLSAIFSGNFELSFFGTLFDMGSASFMLVGFLLMLFSSIILMDRKNAQMVFLGLVVSLGAVLLFQVFRFMAPNTLSFGVLGGSTDNLIGSFNSFALMASFLSILSIFGFEFFSFSKTLKYIFAVLTVLGIILSACVNFYLAWIFLGVFALIIFVYKIAFASTGVKEEEKNIKFPILPFVVILISLMFVMSGQFIGRALPEYLKLVNQEPNFPFSLTMDIAGKSLREDPVFGVGPTRFDELWSKYRPVIENNGPYWNSSFTSGSGLLPTFVATTGVVGAVSWVVFLGFLLWYGIRLIFSKLKNDFKLEVVVFFFSALYLFFSTIFYSGGTTILMLAFALTGAFIGLLSYGKTGEKIIIPIHGSPAKSSISVLILVLLMIATAGFSFKYVERFASGVYFLKAVNAQDIDGAERNIIKTVSLYENDLYARTYSRVYLLKLQTLLTKAQKDEPLSTEDQANFKNYYERALVGAELAIKKNGGNALNYQMKGTVYASVVPAVEGSYESAIEAYTTASSLNPTNPQIKLDMASVALSARKAKEAKDFALEALNLKSNYLDALIVLSQIERSEGNNAQALLYAKQAQALLPQDESLLNYVNSLESKTVEKTKDTEGEKKKDN